MRIFSTLKMEVTRSFETSAITIPTRHHIPEDDILHSHRLEYLKFYTEIILVKRNGHTERNRKMVKTVYNVVPNLEAFVGMRIYIFSLTPLSLTHCM
jgi:hypothetical protein